MYKNVNSSASIEDRGLILGKSIMHLVLMDWSDTGSIQIYREQLLYNLV